MLLLNICFIFHLAFITEGFQHLPPMKFPPNINSVVINIGSNKEPIPPTDKNCVAVIVEPIAFVEAEETARANDASSGGITFIIPAAISNVTGFSLMNVYNEHGYSSSLSEASTTLPWTKVVNDNLPQKRLVPVLTLNHLLHMIPSNLPITFMKTDMQGYDFLAVTSSTMLARVEKIFSEVYVLKSSSYYNVRNDFCRDWIPSMKILGFKPIDIGSCVAFQATSFIENSDKSVEKWCEMEEKLTVTFKHPNPAITYQETDVTWVRI